MRGNFEFLSGTDKSKFNKFSTKISVSRNGNFTDLLFCDIINYYWHQNFANLLPRNYIMNVCNVRRGWNGLFMILLNLMSQSVVIFPDEGKLEREHVVHLQWIKLIGLSKKIEYIFLEHACLCFSFLFILIILFDTLILKDHLHR